MGPAVGYYVFRAKSEGEGGEGGEGIEFLTINCEAVLDGNFSSEHSDLQHSTTRTGGNTFQTCFSSVITSKCLSIMNIFSFPQNYLN